MGETNILSSLKQREKHKLRLLPTLVNAYSLTCYLGQRRSHLGETIGFSGVIETLQIHGLNLKCRFCRKCINKGIYLHAIFLNSSPQPPFHRVSLRAVTVGIRAAIYPFLTKEKIRKRNQNCRKIQLSTNPTLYPSVLNLANFLFLQLSSVLNPNCSQSQFSIREVQISGITMM